MVISTVGSSAGEYNLVLETYDSSTSSKETLNIEYVIIKVTEVKTNKSDPIPTEEVITKDSDPILTNEVKTKESEFSLLNLLLSILVPCVVVLVLIIGLICWCRRKNRNKTTETSASHIDTKGENIQRGDYATIEIIEEKENPGLPICTDQEIPVSYNETKGKNIESLDDTIIENIEDKE